MESCSSLSLGVAVGLLFREKAVLLSQRALHKSEGGTWEFPGGKLEAFETPLQALKRELSEELYIEVVTAFPVGCFPVQASIGLLHLFVYKITLFRGQPVGAEGQALCWVPLAKLQTMAVPKSNIPIIEMLLQQ